MAGFEVWSVFWLLCVMCIAPVKIHCQLVKVYGVCVIPWKQEDTVHGCQQWQERCWQVVTWAPLQVMCGVQTCSAADITRELDIRWVVHKIVRDQLDYWEVCSHWVPKNPTDDDKLIVWAFLVSIWHVTLIKESNFGAETWLITQNLKPEKGCVIDELSSPPSKENGSIVISKDDHGDTVCWLLLWYT